MALELTPEEQMELAQQEALTDSSFRVAQTYSAKLAYFYYEALDNRVFNHEDKIRLVAAWVTGYEMGRRGQNVMITEAFERMSKAMAKEAGLEEPKEPE